MPKILDRLISQLKAKGHDSHAARAIALSSLQRAGDLDKSGRATSKGIRRGNMSPAQRAISRAAKASGRHVNEYKYNPKTNRATLRRSENRATLRVHG